MLQDFRLIYKNLFKANVTAMPTSTRIITANEQPEIKFVDVDYRISGANTQKWLKVKL